MKLKDLIEQYGEYDVVLSKREATNEIMIEGRKPKPKTVWDLKDGDSHVWIDSFGDIEVDYMIWEEGDNCNRQARAIGNIFLTKEEAEKDVERRKVETLLLKYGGRRWYRTNGYNYYIWLNAWNSLVISSTGCVQDTIYFDAEEQAQNAVKEIGEERIKKALFEVR